MAGWGQRVNAHLCAARRSGCLDAPTCQTGKIRDTSPSCPVGGGSATNVAQITTSERPRGTGKRTRLGLISQLVAGDGGQPLGRKNASTGKTTITLDSYGSPLPPTRARAHSYARDLEAESGTICGNIGSSTAGLGSGPRTSAVWAFPGRVTLRQIFS